MHGGICLTRTDQKKRERKEIPVSAVKSGNGISLLCVGIPVYFAASCENSVVTSLS